MNVQEVVNAVSTDMRKMLDSTGADATLILGWVDRIHKDCLHSSFYSSLNQAMITVQSTAGQSFCNLAPQDIRRILLVYDRTFNRVLLPVDNMPGTDTAEQMGPGIPDSQIYAAKSLLSSKTQSPFPEYYRWLPTSGVIHLFPAPSGSQYAGGLDIHYEKRVTNLTSLNDSLLIPDDAKDMVVAGVNALTAAYLKRGDEAQSWMGLYEKLKKGEVIQ